MKTLLSRALPAWVRRRESVQADPVTTLPRLHLSLTATGFQLLAAIQWTMVLAIIGSIGTAAWLWLDAYDLGKQTAGYKSATKRVLEINGQFRTQAAQSGHDLSEDRMKALVREVSFANQLLEKGTFSWTRFLSDLEDAITPRVSFTSVQLNFKDSVITLNGNALTLKDLTAQIDKLEGHPAFRNVVLSQHRIEELHEPTGTLPAQSVSFTMTVVYRPRP